jgi:hypothetical protein
MVGGEFLCKCEKIIIDCKNCNLRLRFWKYAYFSMRWGPSNFGIVLTSSGGEIIFAALHQENRRLQRTCTLAHDDKRRQSG